MSLVFGVLRDQSESIMELKSLMGTKTLPSGYLALGAEGIKLAITNFEAAKKSDEANERLPPMRHDGGTPVSSNVAAGKSAAKGNKLGA